MDLATRFTRLEKRLRVMLIATARLFVPQIGQFIAIRDLNLDGQLSNLAVVFMFATIFLVPTSVILTYAIITTVRKQWREHERLIILGALNAIIALNLTWFFVHPCSWAQVFGLTLTTCK